MKSTRPAVAKVEPREEGFAQMSDDDEANESSPHDFGESSTGGTQMETSGQGMAGTVAAIELSRQAVAECGS